MERIDVCRHWISKSRGRPFQPMAILSNHDLFTLGFLRTRQVLTLRTERVIIHVAAGPYICKQAIIHFSNEIMLRKCTPLGSPRSNLFGYIRQQF